jgi:hypothetical protein
MSMTIRTLMFTATVVISVAIPASAAVNTFGGMYAGLAKATNIRIAAGPVVCMTDEGGGRMKPCDAGYKAANPNWQSSDQCMTDEGGGRYKPCDSGYKQQQKGMPEQQKK